MVKNRRQKISTAASGIGLSVCFPFTCIHCYVYPIDSFVGAVGSRAILYFVPLRMDMFQRLCVHTLSELRLSCQTLALVWYVCVNINQATKYHSALQWYVEMSVVLWDIEMSVGQWYVEMSVVLWYVEISVVLWCVEMSVVLWYVEMSVVLWYDEMSVVLWYDEMSVVLWYVDMSVVLWYNNVCTTL